VLTAPLPRALEQAIEERVGSGGALAATRADLTRRYRDTARTGPVARSREDVLAYAAARLPATYAAMRIALGELALRAPSFAPVTQLDLGAGPGAAVWAARDVWPSLERAVAVEPEHAMAELGRELAPDGVEWIAGSVLPEATFDLVTLGYVLNEVPNADEVIDRAWAAAGEVLVVVEPGTPAGYRLVLAARDRLIAADAHIAAPCPHARECPLAGTDDWCHFAVRVARSKAHRRAKGAHLAHEDEKFSYVAVTRTPAEPAAARVLRHPLSRPGHVVLELCARDELRSETVSKREGPRYRAARKVSWGEAFEA
jgi:ribosomal protein RSM22 (predicted rRNA methylase)